jgi:hypothetical protein
MANTIGVLDSSIGGCFNGVGDIVVFDNITDANYSAAKLSTLANAMSLGDLYNGAASYTGDEPTIEQIKNEQGQVVYSYAEDGTFSFEAVIINLNPAATQKFLKGVSIADASLAGTTWQNTGGTHVGFGHEIPAQYMPVSWFNRDKNILLTFPKALCVANLVNQDGGVGLKVKFTAQKLNTANLKTVMLSTAATPVYTA